MEEAIAVPGEAEAFLSQEERGCSCAEAVDAVPLLA